MTKSARLPSSIFVSYRRRDTSGHVIALMKSLRERFPNIGIFKDTDDLLPGEDFVETIQRELESCAILLVVIGRDWLSIQDDRLKTRRLDNPKDYLRLEVATALKNELVLVVPVLVEGVSMPTADDLPPDLEPLSRRTAVELRDNNRWDDDVQHLIKTLEPALRQSQQIRSWMDQAREAFDRRDLARASELIEQVLALNPNHRPADKLRKEVRQLQVAVTTREGLPLPVQPSIEVDETPGETGLMRWLRAAGFSPRRLAAVVMLIAAAVVVGRLMSGRKEESKPLVSAPTAGTGTLPAETVPAPPQSGPDKTPDTVTRNPELVRLETLRGTARARYQQRQLPQALSAAREGLAIDANDEELRELVNTLLENARTAANRAKQDAITAGAAIEAPTPFNQGLGRNADAATFVNTNRTDQAIEAYWAARSAFATAATQARQASAAKSEIVTVLKRFQSAYVQKDRGAIRAAYPDADTDKILRSLKDCSKLNLTFRDMRIDLLQNGQAQADVSSVYSCQPKTAQDTLPSKIVADTFRLAKRGASWVIINWLIPLE